MVRGVEPGLLPHCYPGTRKVVGATGSNQRPPAPKAGDTGRRRPAKARLARRDWRRIYLHFTQAPATNRNQPGASLVDSGMKPSAIAAALLLSISAPVSMPLLAAGPDDERAAVVASPILRFAQVDAQLYRGGQPDEAGFKYLKDMGIRTIVSFREDNPSEQEVVEGLGMRFVSIPVRFRAFGWGDDFDAADVKKFFEVIDDPAAGPIFFHCQRGADRTGSFAAIYRIARQGWTEQEALNEASDKGMRWWYFPMRNQVRQYAKLVPPVGAVAAAQQ